MLINSRLEYRVSLRHASDISLQANGLDYGVFVCKYAAVFLNSSNGDGPIPSDLFHFQFDSAEFRREMKNAFRRQ
jgi:Ulp1 family protease